MAKKKSTKKKRSTGTPSKSAKKTKKATRSKAKATKKNATSRTKVKKKTTKKKAAKKTKSPVKKVAAKRTTSKSPARKRKSATGKSREPRTLESPGYTGKPEKLTKDTYPESGAASDFICYGPPATVDGEFEEVRICDMGCFTQDGKDSNKYYHGAVVQHRTSKNWYTYFEWGRTGGTSCSFQFVACACEADARACFAKQLHTKNDKRGEWATIAGIRTLRAKKGKDCYLVRPTAKRMTGLPDARNIKSNQRERPIARNGQDGDNAVDARTTKVLRDLRLATIAYTQKSMADASVPTQVAINEARAILGDAQTRVAEIDDHVDVHVQDRKLMQLTNLLFSRIPRKKRVGAAASTWVLSRDNIQDWHDDLDAFESALHAIDIELNPDINIMAEMNLKMDWVDPQSDVGAFLHDWWPQASAHRHQKIKRMTIKNLWEVNPYVEKDVLAKSQKRILRGKVNASEKPRHQPESRVDVADHRLDDFERSNTHILFHGTRSVNVTAILRESLRMPETLVAVAITGAKFGTGIYFSDDWKKSADYTNAKGSNEAGTKGAVKGRGAFMFAADVVLGTPYVAKEVKGFTKPPRGHHSVFGKAGHSGVDDNEFVVYNTDQCRPRYLIEFKT